MATSRVHVLIRTTVCNFDYLFRTRRYEYFEECLNSVLKQTYSHVNIMLLQDSRMVLDKSVHKPHTPAFCKWIESKCKARDSYSFNFYRANCHGPALALYNLRKELLALSSAADDIVILLDDDDFLCRETAIEDICNRMNPSGSNNGANVCLLSYITVGDTSLDISNGAGHIHNSLIKKLEGKYQSVSMDLALADSLGWTKAYKIGPLRKFMTNLDRHFGSEKEVRKFYRDVNAYEDFPDIINLCWRDSVITGCSKPTHAYRKTKSSITARPHIKDFYHKRTANLSLLLNLAKAAKSADMSYVGRLVISRYVIIKLILIENILAKFRNDRLKTFRRRTERTYFYRSLISALTPNRLIEVFADWLKHVILYRAATKGATHPDFVIEAAALAEVKKGYVDVQQCIREKVLAADKPINKYLRRMRGTHVICLIILIVGIAILWLVKRRNTLIDMETILTLFGGLLSAIIAYVGKSILDYNSKTDQDEAARRVYRNELNDLIRHLCANLNVLLEVNRKISSPPYYTRPEVIHFTNLKVPTNSVLLSDEPIKNIMINELDTIARVKVNIRNINNSADFLSSLLTGPVYHWHGFREVLMWELARYLGYILNLLYVRDDPSFRFPDNKEQLERYVKINGIFLYLARQINGINPAISKSRYTDREISLIVIGLMRLYINYKDDREKQRSILVR